MSPRALSRSGADAIVSRVRPVLVLLSICTVAACASAPGASLGVPDDAQVYVEPSPDEPRAPLTVVVAAPPSQGPLAIHVALDGRAVPFGDDVRRRVVYVRPGALFVDVTITREDITLGDDVLVPERQLVPCGRGRFCERTVMTPRTRPLAVAEDVVICRRGLEVLVERDRPHVVHVSSDGQFACRVRCDVGSGALRDDAVLDDAAPLDDCSVDED